MNSLLKFLIFASLLVFLIPAYLYRTTYFSVVVDVAAIVYLVSILGNKIKAIKKDKKAKEESILSSRFDITPIGASFLIFLAISVLAVIFSVDVRDSFWGYPAGRSLAGGFFIYIHYFLFFVVTAAVFRTREEYLNLLNGFVAIAAPISLYAIYERFIKEAIRPSSLFGNPIHLGSFSLFVIYFSAYLFLTTTKKGLKALYASSALLAFMAIYVSESRGPFLGLVGSLVVAVPFLMVWMLKKIKNKKVIALSVAAILLVLVSGAYFLADSRLISRFKNISSDSSVSHRFKVWAIAYKAVKEKPILGWGQENFDLAFNKYFDPSLLSDAGSESWFDRAHNNILDIWATIGTLGVLAYSAIWGAALWAVYNLYRKNNIKEAAVLSLALVAYFVSNLTFFDILVTFIPFVLILVFLNNFGFQELENKYFKIKELKIPEYVAKSIIVTLVVLMVAGFQLARGSYYYYNLKSVGVTPDSAVHYHDKLVSLEPSVFKEEAMYNFAWMLNKGSVDATIFNKYYKKSLDELNELSKRQTFEIKPLYYMSELYLKDYEVNNNADALDAAKQVIERTLSISPRQDLYVALAQIEMQKEDYDEAIEHIKKVQELNPHFARPYFFMSVIYLLNDQSKESEDQLEKAKEYGVTYFPADIANLIFLANHYIFDKKDYPQAIYLLNGILSVDEYNIQALKKIAALHAEMGDKEKAVRYAKKVIEADPNNNRVEAEKFIKSLGGSIE